MLLPASATSPLWGTRALRGRRPFPSPSVRWAPWGRAAPEHSGDASCHRGKAGRAGHSGYFRDKPASQWALGGTCTGMTGEEMLPLHSGSLDSRMEVLPAGGMTTSSLSPRAEGLSGKGPCSTTGRPETALKGPLGPGPTSVPLFSAVPGLGTSPPFFQPNACPSPAPAGAPGTPPEAQALLPPDGQRVPRGWGLPECPL